MDATLRIFCGYDAREAAAYHVFCQSVIDRATAPVSFAPLVGLGAFEGQRDGSNAFTYSRFLVPYLCDFKGWALFADGDMVVTRDIQELFAHKDESKAVLVVPHDYKTRHRRKYIGSEMECPNVDYPRKNWSSVVLWNCAHPSNAVLTRDYIAGASSSHLHRFEWLKEIDIGALPSDWNHLVDEDPPSTPLLAHYTLGVPGLRYYADCRASWHWHQALLKALECGGEHAGAMVERAYTRVGVGRHKEVA